MILACVVLIVLIRVLYCIGEVCFEHDWPRNTIRGLGVSLLLLVMACSAFCQAIRIDQPILTTGPNVPFQGGALPQSLFVANATISICQHPASLFSCTPVTTYNDAAQDAICPPTAQLVQLPGTICTASAGPAANLGFWYGGGLVDYIVTSSYGSFGPFSVGGPVVSGGLYCVTACNPNYVVQFSSAGFVTSFPMYSVGGTTNSTQPFFAPNFTATGAPYTAPSGSISYGGTTVAASNCGSLAGAVGCIVVNIAGTTHYVPYW